MKEYEKVPSRHLELLKQMCACAVKGGLSFDGGFLLTVINFDHHPCLHL